jgi:hypothetical protein
MGDGIYNLDRVQISSISGRWTAPGRSNNGYTKLFPPGGSPDINRSYKTQKQQEHDGPVDFNQKMVIG